MVMDFFVIDSCLCDYYFKTDFSLPLLQFQVSVEHDMGLLTGSVEQQLRVRPGVVQHHPNPRHHKQQQQAHGHSDLTKCYNLAVVEFASCSPMSIFLFFHNNKVLGENMVAHLKTTFPSLPCC